MTKLSRLAANYLAIAEQLGGCSDGSCVVLKPKGMHTNGGCRCITYGDPARLREASRLLMIAQEMAKEILKGGDA